MNGPTYIRKAWRQSTAVLLLTALLIHPCWASWLVSPLEDRVSASDVIFTGKVVKVSTDRYRPVDAATNASEARRLPPRGKEWMGCVFFWHYHLSQSTRLVVLVAAVALVGAGVVLRRRVSKRRMLAMVLTGAVVAVAVGCSIGLHTWSLGGSTESPPSYRLADIKVDKVLKNDLDGFNIQAGDELTLSMAGSKPRMSIEFSFKVGDEGVWMLSHGPTHFYAARPDCLEGYDQQGAIETILTNLRAKYEAAKAKEIPLQEKAWAEMLSMPVCSRAVADAAMGKAVPADVDLTKLRVVNLETNAERMRALFIDTTGRIHGGVPYFANGERFQDGLLSVGTSVKAGIITRYNYVDRKGRLLSGTMYDRTEQFSQGRGLVSRIGFDGYMDATGKEVGPCDRKSSDSFLRANTPRSIQAQHTCVMDFSDGMAAFSDDYRTWGYIDRNGTTVIPPRFTRAGPFSEGLADVEQSAWIKRHPVRSENPNIRLSANALPYVLAPQHFFVDKKGHVINSVPFSSVHPFVNGLARVMCYQHGGRFDALIDKTGKVVLVISNEPPQHKAENARE